eukprot:SAG11_NODE_25012_length_364_cov_4.373585_1_plen_70_part_10
MHTIFFLKNKTFSQTKTKHFQTKKEEEKGKQTEYLSNIKFSNKIDVPTRVRRTVFVELTKYCMYHIQLYV